MDWVKASLECPGCDLRFEFWHYSDSAPVAIEHAEGLFEHVVVWDGDGGSFVAYLQDLVVVRDSSLAAYQ